MTTNDEMHGVELNLVDDKWPDKYVADWKGRSA
jgi:hypothetical protein